MRTTSARCMTRSTSETTQAALGNTSTHDFKYRAAYALNGVRVVGFDNERGKGDHWHVGGRERTYAFVSVEQLVEDFIAAVDAARRGE